MPHDAFSALEDPEFRQFAMFQRVFFDQGWNRFLPDAALDVLITVQRLSAPTAEELGNAMPHGDDEPSGLTTPAWSALDPWTEESLRAVHEEHPPKPSEARTAAEANVEQQRDRDAKVAEIDSYAVALGVRPPHTVADLIEFMVACGVLTRRVDDKTRYKLNPQAPLPGEVLPLSTQRRAAEDELRWLTLNEPVAQKIIGLFQPNGENPLEVLQTNLQRLARSLDVGVDTARAGLAMLLRAPDFSANRDVERVPEHAVIAISVDWDVFAETRFGITAGPRGDG